MTWEQFRQANAGIMSSLGNGGVWVNEIWLQSRCNCEYCGNDLLRDAQTYRGAESDHILQQKHYPRLVTSLSNYAMACASCHKLKGVFDPGEADPSLRNADDLGEEQRRSLIVKVRTELGEKRVRQEADMQTIREVLRKHGWRGAEGPAMPVV